MIGEILLRFALGGAIVSAFAVAGELLQPKTFSGLFGAAPSVAIATLGIAFATRAGEYAGIEARSMLIGCAALFVYSATCAATIQHERMPVWLGAVLAWAVWAAVAFAVWGVVRLAGIA
jgi:uncharacterized membrane protein (GlpM family)